MNPRKKKNLKKNPSPRRQTQEPQDLTEILDLEADSEDGKTQEEVSDQGLKEVALLAFEQVNLAKEVARLEDILKETVEQYRNISEKQLPDKMVELGLAEFKLVTGTNICIN